MWTYYAVSAEFLQNLLSRKRTRVISFLEPLDLSFTTQ